MLITITFIVFIRASHALEGVIPYLFTCPTSSVHCSLYIQPQFFFVRVLLPWKVSSGAVRPPPPRRYLSAVLSQFTRLTDRRKDRQTDGHNSHRKTASVFHAVTPLAVWRRFVDRATVRAWSSLLMTSDCKADDTRDFCCRLLLRRKVPQQTYRVSSA